jgi:hypothetical protein
LASKFAKLVKNINHQVFFPQKNSIRVPKNAKFCADFKSDERVAKKLTPRGLRLLNTILLLFNAKDFLENKISPVFKTDSESAYFYTI